MKAIAVLLLACLLASAAATAVNKHRTGERALAPRDDLDFDGPAEDEAPAPEDNDGGEATTEEAEEEEAEAADDTPAADSDGEDEQSAPEPESESESDAETEEGEGAAEADSENPWAALPVVAEADTDLWENIKKRIPIELAELTARIQESLPDLDDVAAEDEAADKDEGFSASEKQANNAKQLAEKAAAQAARVEEEKEKVRQEFTYDDTPAPYPSTEDRGTFHALLEKIARESEGEAEDKLINDGADESERVELAQEDTPEHEAEESVAEAEAVGVPV